METEKKIELFKPSKWLYIFLFIYYSIWIIQGYGAIAHYYNYGLEEFKRYGTIEWLFFPIYLIATIFCLYAVIKTLRGDKDCITALKWSLVVSFFYTILNPIRGQFATYDITLWSIGFFLRPLYYCIFFIYLCFSKSVRNRYPKNQRKFTPSGWIWSGLLLIFISWLSYGVYQRNVINNYCRKIEAENLLLTQNEVSDGYTLFNSELDWATQQNSDNPIFEDDILTVFYTLNSHDSKSSIHLLSGRSEENSQRIHNRMIYLSSKLLKEHVENYDVKQISFDDRNVNQGRLITSVFELTKDTKTSYGAVMTLFDNQSPKICNFFYDSSEPIAKEQIDKLIDSIRFDLSTKQSNNDEKSDYAQYRQTYRVGQCEYKAVTNMLPTFFHGILPGQLICKMFLKDNESHITNN